MKKKINSETRKYEEQVTDTLVLDAVPTVNSFNGVTSDGVNNNDGGTGGINFYWWFKINGTLDHALDQNYNQWSGYSSLCVPWLANSDSGTTNYQSVWIERM